MSPDMNAIIRKAGNRSRKLPDERGTGTTPTGFTQANPSEATGGGTMTGQGMPTRGGAGGLPNIGQTPAVAAADLVLSQGQQRQMQPQAPQPQAPPPPPPPQMSNPAARTNPLAAPPVQPQPLAMHPPGVAADENQYNYEPQPDGSWKVYPPGIMAPQSSYQASLPRAASTADYRRMRAAFQQPQAPQPF